MNQHDSQELLSRLLDGLHEDLNLIQKKPYIEDKDYTDKDDCPDVAKTFWINFLKRNYSKIVNLFYGQFRAEIKCPKCSYVSVKYDPYELISLPVPKPAKEISIDAYDITRNHDKQARKVTFKVKHQAKNVPTVREMLREYSKAREDGTTIEDFELCFCGFTVHGEYLPLDYSSIEVSRRSKDSSFQAEAVFVPPHA